MARTSNNSAAENEKGLASAEDASSSMSERSPSSFSVLGESKKQNSGTVTSAALCKTHKQGIAFVSPPPAALFSPTCKNPLFLPEKYPRFPAGRYRSPTDSLISPISRGLLAKGRKVMQPIHTFIPPKVLDATYDILENL